MYVASCLKYYQQNFRGVGNFCGSNILIFSSLSLKHDDGLLPYNMPEVIKAGHGLTDIITACDKSKPGCTQIFLGGTVHTSGP